MAYAFAPITLTASTTLDRDTHANGPAIGLNKLDGLTVTLPAAVGSGDKYLIRVAVLATSGSYIIRVASATDSSSARLWVRAPTPVTRSLASARRTRVRFPPTLTPSRSIAPRLVR